MTDTLKINIPEGTSLDRRCIALLSVMRAYNAFQKVSQSETAKHAREQVLGSVEDVQYTEQTLVRNLHELSNNLSEAELKQAKEKQLLSDEDYQEVLVAIRMTELAQSRMQDHNLER